MFKRRYFVIAPNYHGATLFAKLLNDHPNVVSLGDTYPSNRFDQVCGCGELVSQCEFWQSISRRVKADRYRDQPLLLPMFPRIISNFWDYKLYNTLSVKLLQRIIPRHDLKYFATDFESFVEAVYDALGRTEATVYVDGVKSIPRIKALIASGVQVDGVIHIQRDPGDFFISTLKQISMGRAPRKFIPRILLGWRLLHNRARQLGQSIPYLSVTYEGLVEDPDATLEGVFNFLKVPPMAVDELINRKKDAPWHFMGNQSLFHFDGTIKRSKHSLSEKDKLLVNSIAGSYSSKELHLIRRGE